MYNFLSTQLCATVLSIFVLVVLMLLKKIMELNGVNKKKKLSGELPLTSMAIMGYLTPWTIQGAYSKEAGEMS